LSRHPSVEGISRYLDPNPNLRGTMREVADATRAFADDVLDLIPDDSPELSAGLRKLLEAKDCFVRAALDAHLAP